MKLTPKQFIRFCEITDHDPNQAVAALSSRAWPDFREVAKTAEEMADDLTPCDENVTLHAWLFDLAGWVERRLR